MKTLHFKEIDMHMKEYWKTHTIVPSHENTPLYIIEKIEENLTMEEKKIKIIIENFKGKKYTFIMPEDATIECIYQQSGFDQFMPTIEKVSIDATYLPGIKVVVENYEEKEGENN